VTTTLVSDVGVLQFPRDVIVAEGEVCRVLQSDVLLGYHQVSKVLPTTATKVGSGFCMLAQMHPNVRFSIEPFGTVITLKLVSGHLVLGIHM